MLSGGECAEDIQQHFRPALEQIPDNKVVRTDVTLRCFNELSTKTPQLFLPAEKTINLTLT